MATHVQRIEEEQKSPPKTKEEFLAFISADNLDPSQKKVAINTIADQFRVLMKEAWLGSPSFIDYNKGTGMVVGGCYDYSQLNYVAKLKEIGWIYQESEARAQNPNDGPGSFDYIIDPLQPGFFTKLIDNVVNTRLSVIVDRIKYAVGETRDVAPEFISPNRQPLCEASNRLIDGVTPKLREAVQAQVEHELFSGLVKAQTLTFNK